MDSAFPRNPLGRDHNHFSPNHPNSAACRAGARKNKPACVAVEARKHKQDHNSVWYDGKAGATLTNDPIGAGYISEVTATREGIVYYKRPTSPGVPATLEGGLPTDWWRPCPNRYCSGQVVKGQLKCVTKD